MIHPQEALLQEAKAFQQSEAFAPYRKLRQAAEHRLARLMQLGARQARYFGRAKTLFQLLMAATVANLTLVARRVGLMRDRNHPQTIISIHLYALFMVRYVFATPSPRSEPGFSATLLGRCSTRFCGSCAAVLLGETFRSVTAPGKARTTGTTHGPTMAPSTASWSGSRSC